MRIDSIRAKGLEKHVNEYCVAHDIPYRYRHLVDWLENGEHGEAVSREWIRRRFEPVSRPTFDKWLTVFSEEKNSMSQNNNFEVRNEEIEKELKAIGGLIGKALPEGWVFNLVIASAGEGGSTFYISNIEREGSMNLLQELIDKQKDQK